MTTTSKCVHCGAVVKEWERDCPKCGRPVANPDAPLVSDLRSKKWGKAGQHRKKNMLPFIIGIVVIIILIIFYYYK